MIRYYVNKFKEHFTILHVILSIVLFILNLYKHITIILIVEENNPDKIEKEKIHSAQLKVYWKPKLSVVRSHGCFKTRVYDMIKSEITSLLDIKKINHRDAELDEGIIIT